MNIKLCTVLTLALLCASVAASFAQEKKQNVLFIVCDDLNTHVSTSGYPHISTPAFDELAASGEDGRASPVDKARVNGRQPGIFTLLTGIC